MALQNEIQSERKSYFRSDETVTYFVLAGFGWNSVWARISFRLNRLRDRKFSESRRRRATRPRPQPENDCILSGLFLLGASRQEGRKHDAGRFGVRSSICINA